MPLGRRRNCANQACRDRPKISIASQPSARREYSEDGDRNNIEQEMVFGSVDAWITQVSEMFQQRVLQQTTVAGRANGERSKTCRHRLAEIRVEK